MKLLNKYNRISIIATIVVLMMGGVIYYFFINAALVRQLDKSLVVEEQEIDEYIADNHQLPEPSFSKDEQEEYFPITDTIKRNFKSVYVGHKRSRHAYFRQLEFPVLADGKFYKAVVRKSQEKTEDIVELTLIITFVIVVLLLVSLFVINRFVLNRLWRPFYNTLGQLQEFNITGKNPIQPAQTNITEFNQLNGAVSAMTQKAVNDYNEIKSFTENASHEIQTPLAIIASKLELLNQTDLDETQAGYLTAIADTTNRLSKLNQSLILLTKIDNRQFAESKDIKLTNVIELHLNNFEELLHAKNITLSKNLSPTFTVKMNETLVDVLVLNLINNAIKHNLENGTIDIELKNGTLKISNTGAIPEGNTRAYFERFKKGSLRPDSLGLGLSIVKKICDAYQFLIQYNFIDEKHEITINF
jgi:signal transduction histidine kinase